jgi:RHS repeat-associated protein
MGDPHFDMLGYVESHKNRPQVPMYEDNRVTEFEGIKNTFDAAGCLIEQTRPDRTKLRLHYDGAYRLVYIEKTNPDGKQTKISYAYDAISRRVFKGVTEEGKPQEITRYGWDGDRCVYEETADQKITILYLPGTFSPFARIVQKIYPAPESDDPERDKAVDDAWKMVEKIMGRPLKKPQVPEKELEVQFFIPDHAGTPLFLVDAKGEILWEALPDDWKATQEVELVKLLVSEYGVRQFIRFQGQWADEETGFYYNRYRFYDPQMGRYISQDPIGFRGGVNLYAYVEGDPVNWVDPLGLIDMNLFDPSDSLYTNSKQYERDGYFTVGGHGISGSTIDNADNPTQNPSLNTLLPRQLAEMMLNNKKYNYKKGTPVMLISCKVGMGGTDSFAQKLADILCVEVIAANSNVGVTARGEFRLLGSGYDNSTIPATEVPAKMITFYPRTKAEGNPNQKGCERK